jgi:TRAP-type C4-dicarboxylate transport system permease small subunit
LLPSLKALKQQLCSLLTAHCSFFFLLFSLFFITANLPAQQSITPAQNTVLEEESANNPREEKLTLPLLKPSDLTPLQWAMLICLWIIGLALFIRTLKAMIEDWRREHYRNLVKKLRAEQKMKNEQGTIKNEQ